MNKRNKDVEATKLRREDQVLKDLRREYNTAAERVKEKIKTLAEREQSKSVIYQKKYQEQLLNQINSTLDSLDTVNTVSDYLKDSYYDGFMGALYDIQGQGIPIIVPFDQNALTKMISTTSDNIKLSKKLYTNVTALKNRVRKEVSIGIAAGEMYDQVAARIDRAANIGFNNAYRIARTEGHRVSQASALEAMQAAKDSGADVVKQWDSTLDGRTRKEHRKLDGQIAELDQPFRVSGRKAMHPGGFGRPEQDINCRCTVLQRAKWALDQDELDELKRRADFFELDKSKDFADFKKKYMKAAEKVEKTEKKGRALNSISLELDKIGVKYNPVEKFKTKPKDIIKNLAGQDRTRGSCASLGFTYIARKLGFNVLDFRDGESRSYFSKTLNIMNVFKVAGATETRKIAKSELTAANQLLKQVEEGKEYYFFAGRHAAIVRNDKKEGLQYLELQGNDEQNGWKPFKTEHMTQRQMIARRFGCSSSTRYGGIAHMYDLDEIKNTDEFADIVGYINTNESEQVKGAGGGMK